MQTFNLEKQADKLRKLVEKDSSIDYIVIENGYLKVTNKNGFSCYYTPDLGYCTCWANHITTENGFVRLNYRTGYIRYYTSNLKHYTFRSKCKSMSVENGTVKMIYQDGSIGYYSDTLREL